MTSAPQQSSSPHHSGSSEDETQRQASLKNHNQEREEEETMNKIPAATASRAATLSSNLESIRSRIAKAASQRSSNTTSSPPRLLAVSKLKPASDILSLFSQPSPHRHFGENYVQELVKKSGILPVGIRWHFIGQLQSNKCLQLARDVKGLWAVESVDTRKKAERLEQGKAERKKRRKDGGGDGEVSGKRDDEEEEDRLRVYVQLNTSGEESKAGVQPPSSSGSEEGENSECLDLCRFIRDSCPNLKLQGLMTIGAIARSKATTPENENEDFVALRQARDMVAQLLEIDKSELELSMGMSEDFEGAIIQGSDEVRVGSTIFGERPPKKEAKIIEEDEKER